MMRRLYARTGREGLEAWEVFDRRWTGRLEVGMGMAEGRAEGDGMVDGRSARERAGGEDRGGVAGGADSGGEGKEGAAGAGRIGR